jgi:hypothetical protein
VSAKAGLKKNQQLYVGIDVAFAKKKKLPICVVYQDKNRLIPLRLREFDLPEIPIGSGNVAALESQVVTRFANQVSQYLRSLEIQLEASIDTIAIDAPSDYSTGGRRLCEAALDKAGIRCFGTPTLERFNEIKEKVHKHLKAGGAENRLPHAMQLWMLVGFALFRELEVDYRCLEVFPQAVVHNLGAAGIHKFRKEGQDAQLKAIASVTGWEPEPLAAELKACVSGASHDRLDAYMCAWVASLYPDLDKFGTGPNDSIWVQRADIDYRAAHSI